MYSSTGPGRSAGFKFSNTVGGREIKAPKHKKGWPASGPAFGLTLKLSPRILQRIVPATRKVYHGIALTTIAVWVHFDEYWSTSAGTVLPPIGEGIIGTKLGPPRPAGMVMRETACQRLVLRPVPAPASGSTPPGPQMATPDSLRATSRR